MASCSSKLIQEGRQLTFLVKISCELGLFHFNRITEKDINDMDTKNTRLTLKLLEKDPKPYF